MYSNRRKDTPKAGGAVSDVDLIKMNVVHELDDEELEKLFIWVDEIPLSRPKKNMARDFSDGVLMAEILKFKLKTGVELHNYPSCSNVNAKQANWTLMNRKVLNRLKMELSHDLITAISSCKPHAIESVLALIRDKIDIFLAGQLQKQRAPRGRRQYDTTADMLPEADQNSRAYQLSAATSFGREMSRYVPSAEGFYQDGQYQSPTTRRMYPDYTVTDPLGYHSTPGRAPPVSSHMAAVGNGEMLPKGLLDEREVAIENREQTITMLQAKIQRLEQLLTLKDLRIEDLSSKLDKLTQPTFHQPAAQRGQRGTGISNRLANQQRHGGSQPLASHSGRY